MPVIDEINRRIAGFADGQVDSVSEHQRPARRREWNAVRRDDGRRAAPDDQGVSGVGGCAEADPDGAARPTSEPRITRHRRREIPAAPAARTQQPPSSQRVPATTSAFFGMVDDKPVQLYTLTNKNGLVAKITNYGATVTELHVPDRAGTIADVVLGFDSLDGYAKGHRTSARSSAASPIASANAEFTLEGRRYRSPRTTSRTICTAAGRAGTRWSGTPPPSTPPTVRRSSSPTSRRTGRRAIRAR